MSETGLPEHHTATIIINAPVYGSVAGRDMGSPSQDFEPREAPPTLSELQQRLRASRTELRHTIFAFYVNWPSVLMVLGCLALGAFAFETLMTLGSTQRSRWTPFMILVPMTLMLTVLAWWLDATRRPLRHVLASLRSEVHELERVVALSRAGRW